MTREENIYRGSEYGEKALERLLSRLTKEAGGLSLKFMSATQTGFPDRILLFPGGRAVFVELKSHGQHPTRLQLTRMRLLRERGFDVRVVDSRSGVEELVGELRDPGGGRAANRPTASRPGED